MSDTLEIFGTEYTNVTGIKATDDNDTEKTYIRPEGTKSITENGNGIDVTEYASVNVSVSGSSPTLITKSITANGTYDAEDDNADGYSSVAVNVSGGGTVSVPALDVNFIDYDGTIVAAYTASDFASLQALPNNPSHDGLTAQGWNWSLADAKAYVADYGKLTIGQMYITESGDTEIDTYFADSARLSPILTIAVKGTVTVDWGDGSSADTLTGTSLTTRKAPTHTYSATGYYTIKIHVVSGSFVFYCGGGYPILRKNTTANENRVYTNCVKAVRIGNGMTSLASYSFYNCHSLQTITIPNTITVINNYVFNNCSAISSLTVPSSVTTIGTYLAGTCYSLSTVSIPRSVTSLGAYTFYNCFTLHNVQLPNSITSVANYATAHCESISSVTIPEGITSMGDYATGYYYGLASLTIPKSVTTIGTYFLSNCYSLKELHVKPTTPPTLGNNAFGSNLSGDFTIYVPAESLEAYQTATNWSGQAGKMVGE